MIPFIKQFSFEYGQAEMVSPLVRRVVARNPGRFTGPGTGTHIIGHETVAIIDPGPDSEEHFAALTSALAGETVSHVLVTHKHIDHSPLGRRLADHYGALLCGGRGACTDEHGGAVRMEAGDDCIFDPDIELEDGWQAMGPNWTLKAIHTPGHTPRHFCFALGEENTLFCGDHIMAWSTSIVSPPDGSMSDYLDSLQRVRAMKFARLVPTHGAFIDRPEAFISAYIAHRLERETAILALVEDGVSRIRDIVSILYADVDKALHPAAMHSVWAHLIYLLQTGRVRTLATPAIDAVYFTDREADVVAAA